MPHQVLYHCAVCRVALHTATVPSSVRKLPEKVCGHCIQKYKKRLNTLLAALPHCSFKELA
jgi:DNA-directed RNA polymerase subunit RPC12/RpoP